MSLLSDKYAAEAKSKQPQDVKYDTFTEHGLGDKYKGKKEPNHSAVNEVKKLNKRLKSINSPFYAICKDNGTIGYRKVKPSCDPDHPNVTYAREKAVDEALKEEGKPEEKPEEKPAEKPSEKQDKPKKDEKSSFIDELKAKYPDDFKEYGITKASRYKDSANIHVTSKGYIENDFNGRILRLANKFYAPDHLTGVIQFELDGKTVKHREKPKEKEPEPPKADDRDEQSAKFMKMMEEKFNKILESKG